MLICRTFTLRTQTNIVNMEIPLKILNKWKVLRSSGDGLKLAEQNPQHSDELFNRAMRDGKCSDEVFEILAKFYDAKAELVKQYL